MRVRDITLQIMSVCDGIAKRKLQNGILYGVWVKVVYPFFLKQINSSTEAELTQDLNLIYSSLKPFFEKKQITDSISESDRLSGIKLPMFFLKNERKYF